MNTHITKTYSAAFYHLYNIRGIRKYLSKETTEILIHAFISSRVDYCNSLYYGLPAYQLMKLQIIQNAAARLVFQESKYCHITPILRDLHWHPVKYRIDYKILLLTIKQRSKYSLPSNIIMAYYLCHLIVRPSLHSATGHFILQFLGFGTVYRVLSEIAYL